jgi:aspartyl-tRNA(Asn)/glutamyl-tRNA(Gln) amidotransferase subunit C
VRVTEDLVRSVAALARLTLSDDEVRAAVGSLTRILAHVESIQGVDVDDGPIEGERVVALADLRDDAPETPLSAEDALRNAPRRDGGLILAPRFHGD